MNKSIISVKNVSVQFKLRKGTIRAVDNVSIELEQNKITAIVGESGSGKTTLASTFLNYVTAPGEITQGDIHFSDRNVLELDEKQMQEFRWKKISMVFQAAQNALNPILTIEEHFLETFSHHYPHEKREDMVKKCTQLLENVRLDPVRVLASYPHELSGGMKQRVMIAFSLLLNPEVIILDEPTTALDVITQEYIFDILCRLHETINVTMVLLTHDIAVVAKVADNIGVMYAGCMVEYGDIFKVFENPLHPYTKGLIAAAPSLLDGYGERPDSNAVTPDLFNMPLGCPFFGRCEKAMDICRKSKPSMQDIDENHRVACHLYDGIFGEGGKSNV